MSDVMQSTRFTNQTLANRFALAPMTRISAEPNGTPNDIMADHYEAYAKGGFGLLITEGTYTDDGASQGYANQPGIINDAQIEGWKAIVNRVHAAGSKIFVQLMHAGAQVQANQYTNQPAAPQRSQTQGRATRFLWRSDGMADAKDHDHSGHPVRDQRVCPVGGQCQSRRI
ncbi:hypothetical protein [Marinobacter sp. LV10R510-11A]|uniref:oxidoreductase n=1 Tax=Marinobacter sp. LV10R510-11A TaxID=1415568 RepID=UPI0022284CD1|nr:hypothetical protein [Marinobacter sp. LV10R510-11A]